MAAAALCRVLVHAAASNVLLSPWLRLPARANCIGHAAAAAATHRWLLPAPWLPLLLWLLWLLCTDAAAAARLHMPRLPAPAASSLPLLLLRLLAASAATSTSAAHWPAKYMRRQLQQTAMAAPPHLFELDQVVEGALQLALGALYRMTQQQRQRIVTNKHKQPAMRHARQACCAAAAQRQLQQWHALLRPCYHMRPLPCCAP